MLSKTRPEMLLAITPHGTPKQVARIIKGYVDAGLRVPKIMDYGGMAGLSYAASSAQKVREAEDELLKLCGDIAGAPASMPTQCCGRRNQRAEQRRVGKGSGGTVR